MGEMICGTFLDSLDNPELYLHPPTTMIMEMICGTFRDNLDLHLRMIMEMTTEMMAMLPSTTMAMTMILWELTTIIQELTMIFQVLLNSMTTKWVALPNS